MRKTTELEKRIFTFLNDLRESSVTNMWGSPVYVEEHFEISWKEASNYVKIWMKNFNEEGNYLEVEDE